MIKLASDIIYTCFFWANATFYFSRFLIRNIMRDPSLFIARGGKCPLIAIETFRCLLSVPSHKCSSFDLFIFSAFSGHIKASLLIKVIVF